jgi:predicted ribosome quality control (RQC) complex YloA/Tae2 family protein
MAQRGSACQAKGSDGPTPGWQWPGCWSIVRPMDAMSLLALVEDARRALTGALVRGVYPAGSSGLWMELVTTQGVESVLVSADETLPRIVRGTDRPPREKPLTPFVGLARRVLSAARLSTIDQRGLERVVALEFGALVAPASGATAPSRYRLWAELFGSRPNLFLVDASSETILEAVRHGPATGARNLGIGRPYAPPAAAPRSDARLLGGHEAIQAALTPHLAAGAGAVPALRQAFVGLTDRWAREVAARASDETAASLAAALAALLREIESGPWEPVVILDATGDPAGMSPLRLRHLPGDRQRACPSLREAAEHLAAHRSLDARRRILGRLLRRLEERLRSRQAKLADESREFDRAPIQQCMGEILVAHQAEVPRGATQVTLPDPGQGTDATLTIPLDPSVSPAANAERLFKAARRGRRGAMRVTARLAETDAELARVRAWHARAERLTEELESLQRELEQVPRLLSPRDRAAMAASAPHTAPAGRPGARPGPRPERPGKDGRPAGPVPRRFVSSDGLPILVGRDNDGNDYLTVHLARSEDLWLHVQNFSGSHVVVRPRTRTSGFPRRTLVEAAQLAAYYSQARDHGKVTVDYTLRKYVRKPKKAKPGLVTITQEKSIVVSPDKSLVAKLAKGSDD